MLDVILLKISPKQLVELSNIKKLNKLNIQKILKNHKNNKKFKNNYNFLRKYAFAGGVNSGDQQVLYALVKKFRPKNVLEVGTHVGSSTVAIAAALLENQKATNKKTLLTSIDIRNVNDKKKKPWLESGAHFSPKNIVKQIGAQEIVQFYQKSSKIFLQNKKNSFDFIFLDGDHKGFSMVCEICLALKALKPQGLLILHDYFPKGKPIWKNENSIQGPYLAVQKITQWQKNALIIPFKKLPWKTKNNSHRSSLALFTKKD